MATRFLTPLLYTSLLALAGCDDSSSGSDGGSAGGSTSSSGETEVDPADDPTADPTDDPTAAPTEDSTTDASTSGSSTDSDGDSDSDDETDGPSDEPSDTDDPTGVGVCGEDGVPCEDPMILDLGLVGGVISAGGVENTADGGGWMSAVDATAGGIVDAPSNPWIYLQFTDDGLQKIEIDDLEALTSEEWDIAAKRFGVRLNSGSSGPGCVTVATIVDDDYESVDAVPDDATYRAEAFYDGTCGLVDDGSGVGAPNYALTPWWFYPGCVGVSYVPFLIETGEGRHVKFMVEQYYESGQAECNDSGAMGSGSANFTWRWAYLD